MKVLALTWKNIVQILRDWKAAIFLLIMPVLFTVFFGLVFKGEENGQKEVSEEFRTAAAEAAPSRGENYQPERIIAGLVTGAAEETGAFRTREERNRFFADALKTADSELGKMNNRVVLEVLTPEAREMQGMGGFQQSSPGMIVQFTIFGLITSAMVFILERKTKTLGRLMTAPISFPGIIGGQILAMFTVIFLQQLVLVLLGRFVFHVPYFGAPLALFTLLILFALWATGLGVMISTLAKTEDQVVTFSLISMFIFAAFGGAWFPLEVAGETFAAIGHILPTAWVMDGFHDIILRGRGIASVLEPAGVLLGYTAVFFLVALLRLRKLKVHR